MHRTELFHEPPKSHFRVLRYEIKKLPCKEEIFISHWVSKELAQSFGPCFKKEKKREEQKGGVGAANYQILFLGLFLDYHFDEL